MFRTSRFTAWLLVGMIGIAFAPRFAEAQLSEPAAWSTQVRNQYRVVTNLTYLTANNWEAKLDLYLPRESSGPHPTILYFHGGGWTGGRKESSVLSFLPYLEMGWAVVNVEYRLARVSPAPAAVEDCLCALRWVSMLRSHLVCGEPRRFAVIHGARHSWDLGYRSELMTLDRMCSNFTYIAAISRPEEEPAPWAGETGYIQDVWQRRVLEESSEFRASPEDTHVFLCGNPSMIVTMANLLNELGFKEHRRRDPGTVHVERYW